MTTKILSAKWIFTAEPGRPLLENHSIVIEDGLISEIVPTDSLAPDAGIPKEKFPNSVLLPGFINSHAHASMSLLRCVGSDLSTLDWLEKAIWPLEGKLMSPEFVRDGALLGAYEMAASGITCCQDMYFFPEEAAKAAQMGLRITAGGIIIGFPSAQAKSESDYFEQARKLYFDYKDHPLISVNMAPHAPYSVSEEMLKQSMRFARDNNCRWQIHLSETKQEVENSLKAHGMTPVAYLDKIGCLNELTTAIHCVCLTDEDIELLAKAKASVVHCPTSNMKLGCGIARVRDMLDAGINVAIGTDGCASGHKTDVLAELRFAGLLSKGISQDPTVLPVETLLAMGTRNGALALGKYDKIGVLKKGMSADIIVFDMSNFNTQPCFDPLSNVIYCGETQSITKSYVQGQVVAEKTLLETELPNWRAVVSKCNLLSWQNRVCEILQND